LEKRIYIPLPDFESRKALININLRTVEVSCGYIVTTLANLSTGPMQSI